MSTQPRSDLKFTPPARVSRNALNPFGAKDLTVLAATLSPVRPSAREALIATAPYRQSEFRKDFAEYICAAPLATGIIDAAIAAEHFNAPTSALKAMGLRSRTAPRGKPRTGEGWQDHLASVEGLTVALPRARARSEAASRARQLLAGDPTRFVRTIDGNARSRRPPDRRASSRDRIEEPTARTVGPHRRAHRHAQPSRDGRMGHSTAERCDAARVLLLGRHGRSG